MYNFGIYHWRRRARQFGLGMVMAAVGATGLRRGGPLRRVAAACFLLAGLATAGRPAAKLAAGPPWAIDAGKYAALADTLPLATADRVLDVGCGTGRSLVGLAPAIPSDATVIGLDVFDDRVIFGNAPALARRNAARAGLATTPVRGDAASLPVADGSVDVVTACRVLHDLPKAKARLALAEARRALAPDGTLGVLELPIPHDEGAEPEPYWRDLVEDAGFIVNESRMLDGEYVVLAATP